MDTEFQAVSTERVGEMAWQLRALAALLRDLSSGSTLGGSQLHDSEVQHLLLSSQGVL